MIHLTNSPTYDKQSASGSLEVCDVTFTDARDDRIYFERFLSSDEMIYLRRGELCLRVNGASHTLRRDTFFFLRRFATVSGEKLSESPCEFYTVAYNGEGIVPSSLAFREITLTGSPLFAEEIMKRLLDAKRFGEADENEMNALFLALTLEARRAPDSGVSVVPLMERTIRMIDDNIHSILTVDEVSEKLGYNRDYLSKQFLACYGVTIKKYMDQKKLGIAKHLLLNSKMSVEQIARSIGFDDTEHFCKFFRYHEKLSPNRYRKNNT